MAKSSKNPTLIPMSEIDPDARKIAVLWVEGYRPGATLEMQQKHKLASDIMNYARRHAEEIVSEKMGDLYDAHFPNTASINGVFSGTEHKIDEDAFDFFTEEFNHFLGQRGMKFAGKIIFNI